MTTKNAKKRRPSPTCFLCDHTQEEVGGMRITAQHTLSTCLSEQRRQGGDPNFPDKSIPFINAPKTFLVVRGKKGLWTEELIQKVQQEYRNGFHPWFCQTCAGKVCPDCGAHLNKPPGAQVIYDDGCGSYMPGIVGWLGCNNPSCKKFRKMNQE